MASLVRVDAGDLQAGLVALGARSAIVAKDY